MRERLIRAQPFLITSMCSIQENRSGNRSPQRMFPFKWKEASFNASFPGSVILILLGTLEADRKRPCFCWVYSRDMARHTFFMGKCIADAEISNCADIGNDISDLSRTQSVDLLHFGSKNSNFLNFVFRPVRHE